MMKRFRTTNAHTLVELLFALGIVGVVAAGLLLFTSTFARFTARNLATNHSHDTMRICGMSLFGQLRDSGSSFRLFDYDGTNFTDISPSPTTDVDSQTSKYVSTRANGVRFRRLAAGPLRLMADCTASSTTMVFDCWTGTSGGFTPAVGDKLVLPLMSKEFDITAVSGTPSSASKNVTVTISKPLGFTLNATGSNFIVGSFYRRAAFTVWQNKLRYHENFTGASRANYQIIREGVTSPKPFSLLFNTASSPTTDALELRVSMEVTDLNYSNRKFGNSTTTLRSVVPPRNQPTSVASTN